jgi:transcriptional regulator with XRE-family HTH domain
MDAATISPTTYARSPVGKRGSDQMIGTSTPSVTAAKSRFRIARERKDLTQQQVADRCELSLKTIKRYDAGGRPRSIEMAQRLAEVLEHPLDWLWPPDEHLNVRVARAKDPTPSPTEAATIPDPREVLATLHQTRPRSREPRARWLAAAIVAVAVVTTAVVVAATGGKRPTVPQTSSGPRSGIAPTLGIAAPPVMAAHAVETANTHRASKRHPKQPSRHDGASSSGKHVGRPSGGASTAGSLRSAQSTSTSPQRVAPRTATNATSAASSPPTNRQPAATSCEFPPC